MHWCQVHLEHILVISYSPYLSVSSIKKLSPSSLPHGNQGLVITSSPIPNWGWNTCSQRLKASVFIKLQIFVTRSDKASSSLHGDKCSLLWFEVWWDGKGREGKYLNSLLKESHALRPRKPKCSTGETSNKKSQQRIRNEVLCFGHREAFSHIFFPAFCRQADSLNYQSICAAQKVFSFWGWCSRRYLSQKWRSPFVSLLSALVTRN